ncbi:MAG TPA: hypothetical protein VMM92_09950 [Thermoanaerobaculia bacterium]|nr:hypothetical protein [Thermoanaerobaculia bacterium]
MKKSEQKNLKLALSRETLRTLESATLGKAAAGALPTYDPRFSCETCNSRFC